MTLTLEQINKGEWDLAEERRRREFYLLWKGMQDTTTILACRWVDEQGYESISTYKKHLQKVIATKTNRKVQITKMLRRPFGFECSFNGASYRVWFKMSTSEYFFKRMK